MTADGVRHAIRAVLAIVTVTAVNAGGVLIVPASPAPGVAFLGVAFVVLAATLGRAATLIGVTVGTLELALILPGEGFAVTRPDDALALIGVLAIGLVAARATGHRDRTIAMLSDEGTRLREAQAGSAAFLHELSHRIANDFAMLAALARMPVPGGEGNAELAGRLIVLARVYRKLRIADVEHHHIAARGFLEGLCEDLQRATLGSRPIALDMEIAEIGLPLGQMVVLGLITNELLTNVWKHAFPQDEPGVVTVILRRHIFRPDLLEYVIRDNGVGFVGEATSGTRLGRRILSSLASQLRGDVSYARLDGWTVATVQFPADEVRPPEEAVLPA